MAIRGVNLTEKENFIHPDDEGHPEHAAFKLAIESGKTPELPTVYHIGNLTSNDRVEFGDMAATPTMKDGGITMSLRNVQKAYAVVQRGLKGWENMLDADGKPVAFTTTTGRDSVGGFPVIVSPDCMVHLPQFVIVALSNEIQRKNGMSGELSKKFEGQSQLSDELNSVIGNVGLDAAPTSDLSEVAPNPQ